jgi:hypothetical protein
MAAPDLTQEETPPDASASDTPQSFFAAYGTLLGRDVAIALTVLSLFAAADAWRVVTGTAFAGGLSIMNGLLAGFLVTSLGHEWGHFTGGRWSGATMSPKPITAFVQVYDYDYAHNTPSQFQAMSIGGNVGHFLVLLLLFVALPLETPGRIALVAGSFGSTVFASSVEFPVISKARAGMAPVEALGTIPRDFIRRNGTAGALAALFAFIVL